MLLYRALAQQFFCSREVDLSSDSYFESASTFGIRRPIRRRVTLA